MNILVVNACVRNESRTKILSDYLLSKLSGNITEINLNQDEPKPFNQALLEKRDILLHEKKYDDKMFDYAHQFASSDVIIIATPFWDLSFPALLKTFIEHITVKGITFKYAPNGEIIPLCKAKTLYYVTTMGGHHTTAFGFSYIEALSKNLYGINDIRLIKAEGLDIQGNDVSQILQNTKEQIDTLLS